MITRPPITGALSATEISSALKQSLADGETMCIVSLMETGGRPATQIARLLVKEGGALIGGTLGARALDEIAARHAVALMKDDRQEIVVARPEEVAPPLENEIGPEEVKRRVGDARLL